MKTDLMIKPTGNRHRILWGLIVCLLAITLLEGCLTKLDQLSGYKKHELPGIATPPIVNPDFADGTSGWRTGAGYASAPGQGFNSTGGAFL